MGHDKLGDLCEFHGPPCNQKPQRNTTPVLKKRDTTQMLPPLTIPAAFLNAKVTTKEHGHDKKRLILLPGMAPGTPTTEADKDHQRGQASCAPHTLVWLWRHDSYQPDSSTYGARRRALAGGEKTGRRLQRVGAGRKDSSTRLPASLQTIPASDEIYLFLAFSRGALYRRSWQG